MDSSLLTRDSSNYVCENSYKTNDIEKKKQVRKGAVIRTGYILKAFTKSKTENTKIINLLQEREDSVKEIILSPIVMSFLHSKYDFISYDYITSSKTCSYNKNEKIIDSPVFIVTIANNNGKRKEARIAISVSILLDPSKDTSSVMVRFFMHCYDHIPYSEFRRGWCAIFFRNARPVINNSIKGIAASIISKIKNKPINIKQDIFDNNPKLLDIKHVFDVMAVGMNHFISDKLRTTIDTINDKNDIDIIKILESPCDNDVKREIVCFLETSILGVKDDWGRRYRNKLEKVDFRKKIIPDQKMARFIESLKSFNNSYLNYTIRKISDLRRQYPELIESDNVINSKGERFFIHDFLGLTGLYHKAIINPSNSYPRTRYLGYILSEDIDYENPQKIEKIIEKPSNWKDTVPWEVAVSFFKHIQDTLENKGHQHDPAIPCRISSRKIMENEILNSVYNKTIRT